MKIYNDTQRTTIQKITESDRDDIASLLKDVEIMYAWEHGFSDAEVDQWYEKNNEYMEKGIGFAKVNQKGSNQFLGIAGLIVERIRGKEYLALAYIFKKEVWNHGYATETAKAIVEFAFENGLATKILCDMRPQNLPSKRVAEKIGMKQIGEFVKIYRGKEMPHLLYEMSKDSLE